VESSNKNENRLNFTITGTLNRVVLDGGNNPVDGIVIYFVSGKGTTGSVEIPIKSYTKETALKMIADKVAKLEELLP